MRRSSRECARPLLFLASCVLALGLIPAARCQVAEPPEESRPPSQRPHIMNFPMGEETCAPTYTYHAGPTGPAHWLGVCRTGRMQAPVDIEHAQKLPLGRMLKFGYQPVGLDVINDCNHYRLLVRFPQNEWLRVGRKPYFLSELHFSQPGENAVNGKRPRMAVELVHLDPESAIAIVEVPVVAGRQNRAMKILLAHVPAPGKENKLPDVKIDARDFLPQDRSFYRVPGSLTVPICNEGVTWYVMKHPIELSRAQIAAYAKYYHDTARPLQPANGRPVAESE